MANVKRLIDKEKLLEKLTWLAKNEDQFRQSVICGVMHTIAVTPTVDAVEVVRCKDCNYSYDGLANLMCGRCGQNINGIRLGGVSVKAEHFCSYGERRTDD